MAKTLPRSVVQTAVHEPPTFLVTAIRQAWAADTSYDPDRWSPANPAWGQCAVTALIVQDALGGELVRGVAAETTHFWNELPDGSVVDLTLEQFGTAPPHFSHVDQTARDYVLAWPETVNRYELLAARVGDMTSLRVSAD